MHVVGARFPSLESAATALAEIRSSVPVPHADVAVRPLGSTRYEEPARDFLLAGRFASGDVRQVIEIARAYGGTLLSNRVEWPQAQLGSRAPTMGQWTAREQRPRAGDRQVSRHARAAQASRAGQPSRTPPSRGTPESQVVQRSRPAPRIHPTPPAPPSTSRRRLRRPDARLRARAARVDGFAA
jgi:hypothetical protein